MSVQNNVLTPRFAGLPPSSPKVALIERGGGEKVADIDGDGIADLTHTDVCARIIKALCPQAEIHQFLLVRRDPKTGQVKDNQTSVVAVFRHLLEQIRKGRPYAAVNLSYANMETYAHPLLRQAGITPETISQNHRAMLAGLKGSRHPEPPMLHQKIQLMQTLARQGTPVYQAAGNDANKAFAWESLAQDCFQIGATNAKGIKEGYSANHSLVNRWEQGTFSIAKVRDGYDITGDGQADVKNSEVSGGEPFVNRFVGKSLEEVRVTADDIDRFCEGKLQMVSERLFPLSVLEALQWISPEDAAKYGNPAGIGGEYAAINPQGELIAGFRIKNGRMIYDPDGSGREGAVSALWGTSLATPFALGKDLQARYGKTLETVA